MAKNEYGPHARVNHGDKEANKGKNPNIQVHQWPSGHICVYDCTPENPRIFIAHESGSYVECTTNGQVTAVSVGSSQFYGKRGGSFTLDENGDFKLGGHSRLVVGGGSYIEVAGDGDIGVAGNTTLFSKGNLNAHVDNLYFGCKGNAKFNVGGDMLMDIKGNHETKVGQDQTNDVGQDQTNDVGGKQTHDVSDVTSLDTRKYEVDANIDHEGNMTTKNGVHVDDNGYHQT